MVGQFSCWCLLALSPQLWAVEALWAHPPPVTIFHSPGEDPCPVDVLSPSFPLLQDGSQRMGEALVLEAVERQKQGADDGGRTGEDLFAGPGCGSPPTGVGPSKAGLACPLHGEGGPSGKLPHWRGGAGQSCLRMKTAEPGVQPGWLCELRQPPCSL